MIFCRAPQLSSMNVESHHLAPTCIVRKARGQEVDPGYSLTLHLEGLGRSLHEPAAHAMMSRLSLRSQAQRTILLGKIYRRSHSL